MIPDYEKWLCTYCGKEWRVSFGREPKKCPECGRDDIRPLTQAELEEEMKP